MSARLSSTLIQLSILLFLNQFAGQTAHAQVAPELKPDAENSVHTLPAGTIIRVRMDNGISSRSASVNDTFTTTVSAPVRIRSVEVIPVGTVLEGRIVRVTSAKRGGVAGSISVSFETMKLPGGAVRRITGEFTDLTAETVEDTRGGSGKPGSDNVTGSGSTGSSAVFIAGGAGAGVLAGALAKGGGGAAIGGALGAGAGLLASYLRKGEEAMIGTNTEFGVLIKQNVALPVTDY